MTINKKIIFISGTPISKITGEKLDPYRFLSSNFDVEYWNLTSMFYSKKALDLYFGGHPEYRYKFPIEKQFNKPYSVKKELKKLQDDVIFCNVDFFMQSNFWLLRGFKKNNIHYYVGPRRTTHSHEVNRDSLIKKIFNAILNGSLLKKIRGSAESNINNLFFYRLKLLLYKNTTYYQKPDFVIGSGFDGRTEAKKLTNVEIFFSIRSPDISWDKLPNMLNERYCVYVDESIIYSPDRALFNDNIVNSKEIFLINSSCNDFDLFLTNICRVFEKIEKKLDCKIVIACSGKYKYDDEKLYGGRKMYYGNTNQLIQNSELVIGHNSTGLYQAVIDRKNIITFTDSTLSDYKNFATNAFAKMLNIKTFNTLNFSEIDLDNLGEGFSEYQQIEEQYFREKNAIDEYHEIVKKHFDKIH
jgi:hypothetical protein